MCCCHPDRLGVALAGSQEGASAFDMPLFAFSVGLAFLIQWLAFIPAYLLQTEKFFDPTGSLTYISVTVLAVLLSPVIDARSLLLLALVVIWAVRLGSFLFHGKAVTGSLYHFIATWVCVIIWIRCRQSLACRQGELLTVLQVREMTGGGTMKGKVGWVEPGFVVVGILLVSLACGQASGLVPEAVATPTPTMLVGGAPGGNEPPAESRCKGLNGTLEVQILAGPAAAVGLEPFGVGNVPFSVVSDSPPFAVQGGGSVSYHNMLQEDWGTYTVDMDLALTVTGECTGAAGAELLEVSVQLSGDQMVEVRAVGFQGDYPWSGSQTLALSFPLQEGAMAAGEGWSFVLHLNQ